ncbi:hypothetical protein LCM4579_27640 [Ensifer sp. LCM 4579]|nr:hypothetical protein LCM4579_27640 [Ensifer sp. LCM 4579]
MRLLVEDLRAEWRSLDERIAAFDAEFVRMALIYGARAVLPRIMAQDTPLGRWARSLLGRAHKNIVVVALAAKLARIVWAVLRKEDSFDPAIAAA